MAHRQDKGVFAFLESRNLFKRSYAGTLQEFMTQVTTKQENRNRAEHPRKKARKK
jgi:hypothetical protein